MSDPRDLGWEPPEYRVDAQGKVAGYVNTRHPNNWGRWGEHDEQGTANLITAANVAAAAGLVRTGQVVSCAIPIDRGGPVHPARIPAVHLFSSTGTDLVAGGETGRRYPQFQGTDDYLFMPVQGSTQWDALSHVGYDDCLYNGYWVGSVEAGLGAKRCSIHHLANTMVGRGVLLDVARHLGQHRLEGGTAISPEQLDQCAAAQGVTIQAGDMVLIRTGHLDWYYQLRRKDEFWRAGAPGLSLGCAEWAHAHDIAAVAMDNVAVEVEPFEGGQQIYPLHARLIRDLGLTLGELWWLEDLADVCLSEGRYEFFLSAPPLKISNAAGSMLNPVAVL